ncbi:hypothetical protein H9P43_005317 [Blastocladiella emersonii ATCC 22665]|nr:hypothetical protein H9P43_005288 [Blastocladiella emersonii ATCC 22665]KAI9179985.1 hypothetical protein H9P43_005317 [Blastocladiella emersonii ATCC 22665]
MTTSADVSNFWQTFTQTALNRDAGSAAGLLGSDGSRSSPHRRGGGGASAAGGAATSSFLVVPAKRNFEPLVPTTSAAARRSLAALPVNKLLGLGKGVAGAVSSVAAAVVSPPPPHHPAAWPPASAAGTSSAVDAQSVFAGPAGGVVASDPNAIAATVNRSPPSSPAPQQQQQQHFLNLRDALLPKILGEASSSPSSAPGATTASDNYATGLSHAAAGFWPGALPLDSHWYAMNQLRIHAGAPERSDGGLARLQEYYALLLWMEERFPFATDEVDVAFTWFDAFAPHKKAVTARCIQVEKAAVLFNLGALYSQLAANQPIWTPDGIKVAAGHFQRAAGVFAYVRDVLAPRFRLKLGKAADLSQQTLHALSETMLAQAHECFVEKANLDAASSTLTSQIAAQTADHYELALRASKSSSSSSSSYSSGASFSAFSDHGGSGHHGGGVAGGGRAISAAIHRALAPLTSSSSSSSAQNGRFPAGWMAALQGKALLYTALAHFHAPATLGPDVALGERIARLIIAKTLAERASKEGQDAGGMCAQLLDYYSAQISGALHIAEVENTQKYQVGVVDPRHLAPLRRLTHSCVSCTPFALEAVSGNGTTGTVPNLLLAHAAFSLDEAVRSQWRRAVRSLTELSCAQAEGASVMGELDDALAHLRAPVRPVGPDGGTGSDPNNPGSNPTTTAGGGAWTDETALLALAHTLESIAAEETILPAGQLVQALADAVQSSRNLAAQIHATLDRIDVTQFARSPSAFAAVGSMRSRLAPLTTEIQRSASALARAQAQLQATAGLCVHEWSGDRIQRLGDAIARGRGVLRSASQAISDTIEDTHRARTGVAEFLAHIGNLSADMGVAGVATVQQETKDLAATWASVRSAALDALRVANRVAAESQQSAAGLSASEEAAASLNGLAAGLRTLSELRTLVEGTLPVALDTSDQVESLAAECASLPFAVAPSAPPQSERAAAGGGRGNGDGSGAAAGIPVLDPQRQARLVDLQRRLARRSNADRLREAAKAARAGGNIPRATSPTSPPASSPSKVAAPRSQDTFNVVRTAVSHEQQQRQQQAPPQSSRRAPRNAQPSSPVPAARSRPRPVPASCGSCTDDEDDGSLSSRSATASDSDSRDDGDGPARAGYPVIVQDELARAIAANEARGARASHLELWASEQVAIAKLRKKLWKEQQAKTSSTAAAAKHSSSSTSSADGLAGRSRAHDRAREREHHHRRHERKLREAAAAAAAAYGSPAAGQHGKRQQKSDSGVAGEPAADNLSEAVSQLKLKTDAILTELTSAVGGSNVGSAAGRSPLKHHSGEARRSSSSRKHG